MTCIVFIPDGNRRWAKKNLLSSAAQGHSKGHRTAQEIIEAAFNLGIQHVVFLAATDLNLMRRPAAEVRHLTALLKNEMRLRLRLGKKGTRLCLRGSWKKYVDDSELEELSGELERSTCQEGPTCLTILFGHNGLDEVIDATAQCTRVAGDTSREGIRSFLPTAYIPEVDLIVRTGLENGDFHLSGDLLPYHMRKAYLHYTETLWPDFTPDELARAYEHFLGLPKRLGA